MEYYKYDSKNPPKQPYILNKSFERKLGKEEGDYYNDEFAESIEELLDKRIIYPDIHNEVFVMKIGFDYLIHANLNELTFDTSNLIDGALLLKADQILKVVDKLFKYSDFEVLNVSTGHTISVMFLRILIQLEEFRSVSIGEDLKDKYESLLFGMYKKI